MKLFLCVMSLTSFALFLFGPPADKDVALITSNIFWVGAAIIDAIERKRCSHE